MSTEPPRPANSGEPSGGNADSGRQSEAPPNPAGRVALDPNGLGQNDLVGPVAELAARIATIGPDGRDRPGDRPSERRSTPSPGHVLGGPPGSRRTRSGRSAAPGPARSGGGGAPPGDPEATARQICLRLLTIAPRPRAGLAQALARRKIPAEVAERVLDRMTEVGLLDDAAYAAAFVRTKQRDRALGRVALRTELRRRGIDEEPAAQALAQVDPESERGRAEQLVDRRIGTALAAGTVAARRRLLGLLARRGYPADVAIAVVDRALQAHADD